MSVKTFVRKRCGRDSCNLSVQMDNEKIRKIAKFSVVNEK